MIEDALRFYLGFLSAEKSEDYLCSPSRLCWEGLKDSENRLARMDFKNGSGAGKALPCDCIQS